ncbi:MAG: phosphatidylserine decarboxylase [Candidatus Dadabacteria bacterium]|nr:MAG: phosphatidylserine decarboxylase [Candidatus Dadabacteria bacterium]
MQQRFIKQGIKTIIYLLTKSISWISGKLASLNLAPPLNTLIIKAYAKLYKINTTELPLSIEKYKSLQEFFCREPKPSSRPIANSYLISPVDGLLREVRKLSGNVLFKVKKMDFTLSSLVLEDIEPNKTFSFFYFYLSPSDFHHVYSPIKGEIIEARCINGALLPVNNLFNKILPQVIFINERVVIKIKERENILWLVMVGALNVGSIELAFTINKTGKTTLSLPVKQGDKLGTFKMGSAVLLISEKDLTSPLKPPVRVKIGEKIA